MPFSELLEKLPLPAGAPFQARPRAAGCDHLRPDRRAPGQREDAGDLLSMLLLAQDEEGDGRHDRQAGPRRSDDAVSGRPRNHRQRADLDLVSALAESAKPKRACTPNSIACWAGGCRRSTTCRSLRYTESVFCRSAAALSSGVGDRAAAPKDYPVGDYVIPARSMVLMSPYVVHRDPRWFPDPLAFRPERWLAEDPRARSSPISPSAAARACASARAFRLDGRKLLLAALAQRWRLRLVPGHRVATRAVITLRPRHGMKMTVSGLLKTRTRPRRRRDHHLVSIYV